MTDTKIDPITYHFKALTDVWTGGMDKKPGGINTGLLGSIRWWFEVLVRGLDGWACDPTESTCRWQNNKDNCCSACILFGCTGWARKFRFEVLDQTETTSLSQIFKKKYFTLRFTPLRPICDEEWALLDITLRLIAQYGAIGGRTVLKPSIEKNRMSMPHHKDYGLIQLNTPKDYIGISRKDLETFLPKQKNIDQENKYWASLEHFWCVNGQCLKRINDSQCTFNRVIGRKEPKYARGSLNNTNDIEYAQNEWLAGKQQISKKVFSFKDPARTFGFIKSKQIDFDEIKKRLKNSGINISKDFLTGDEIINAIIENKEKQP